MPSFFSQMPNQPQTGSFPNTPMAQAMSHTLFPRMQQVPSPGQKPGWRPELPVIRPNLPMIQPMNNQSFPQIVQNRRTRPIMPIQY
jgi:hypothetical protein